MPAGVAIVLVTVMCACGWNPVLPIDQNPAKQPNVLVIVSDNQGWKDIGYNGSEIRTPILDGLASSGVRLDQHYVYTMCSPTRAAFLSGRAPSRFGILGAIGQRSRKALPRETTTVADILKRSGYETSICGKWHVGLRPEVGPRQYGFDETYGFFHGQIDKLSHRYKNGDRTWHRNDQYLDEPGHSLDLITEEAIRFIVKDRVNPFFLYVPYGAPHPPLQESSQWTEPYEKEISVVSRRLYAAAVTHMDDAIGRLVKALDSTGQRGNTIVIFFSDNGAIENWPPQPQNYEGRFGPYPKLGDNGLLRGWIGELYDGCLRTPALVNWPGVLEPRVVDDVVSVLDWFPTLAGRTGSTISTEWNLEGRDIWSVLDGSRGIKPPELYWKSYNSQRLAIRSGDWKLIMDRRAEKHELYNMRADPYERDNLAADKPQLVERLVELLERQASLDVDP